VLAQLTTAELELYARRSRSLGVGHLHRAALRGRRAGALPEGAEAHPPARTHHRPGQPHRRIPGDAADRLDPVRHRARGQPLRTYNDTGEATITRFGDEARARMTITGYERFPDECLEETAATSKASRSSAVPGSPTPTPRAPRPTASPSTSPGTPEPAPTREARERQEDERDAARRLAAPPAAAAAFHASPEPSGRTPPSGTPPPAEKTRPVIASGSGCAAPRARTW